MDKAKQYSLLTFFLTGLSFCASEVRPPFETMDDAGLALYNNSSSFDEKIICREEVEGWYIFSGAISFREEIGEPQNVNVPRVRPSSKRQMKLCLSVRELKYLQAWGGNKHGSMPGYNGVESYQPADAADYPSTFN